MQTHTDTLSFKRLSFWLVTALLLISLLLSTAAVAPLADVPVVDVIVQGANMATAADAVRAVSGEVTHELSVIDAVAATVPGDSLAALERVPTVTRVWLDAVVRNASVEGLRTVYGSAYGVDVLTDASDIMLVGMTIDDVDAGTAGAWASPTPTKDPKAYGFYLGADAGGSHRQPPQTAVAGCGLASDRLCGGRGR